MTTQFRHATGNETDGTYLQDSINTTYAKLVSIFGQPTDTDIDGKVQAEWALVIDGEICTIYDWKEDQPVEKVTDWHIGGKSKRAGLLVAWAVDGIARLESSEK